MFHVKRDLLLPFFRFPGVRIRAGAHNRVLWQVSHAMVRLSYPWVNTRAAL